MQQQFDPRGDSRRARRLDIGRLVCIGSHAAKSRFIIMPPSQIVAESGSLKGGSWHENPGSPSMSRPEGDDCRLIAVSEEIRGIVASKIVEPTQSHAHTRLCSPIFCASGCNSGR